MGEKKNYDKFRALLHTAIGPDRTQAEFAQEAGISPEHISRMLRAKDISRPSMATLRKIAGHAFGGITLSALAGACGYNIQEPETIEDIDNNVAYIIKTLANGLNEMSSSGIYSDIDDFLNMVNTIYAEASIIYDIDNYVTFDKPQHAAEKACTVTAMWAQEHYSAVFGFGLYYTETSGGNVIISGCEFAFTELLKLKSTVAIDINTSMCTDEIISDNDYLYTVKYKSVVRETPPVDADELAESTMACFAQLRKSFPDLSTKELILRMVMGNPDAAKRPMSVEGYGFYMDEYISDNVIRKFFANHSKAFTRTEKEKDILEQILAGGDIAAAFDGYYNEKLAGMSDWRLGVAVVMYRETDISFGFWGNSDEEYENRPCIMFEECSPWDMTETEKELTKDSLVLIIDDYARELRCEYSECYHIMSVDKD